MTEERKKWEDIYRATDYVCPEAGITLIPGEPCAILGQLTSGFDEKGYAFITAWNPGSEPVSSAQNRKQNSLLEERITQGRYIYFEGKGIPREEGWEPEDSYLILGIKKNEALALGKEFGQRAILCGHGSEKTELLFIEDF